jgi:hypothetical protein
LPVRCHSQALHAAVQHHGIAATDELLYLASAWEDWGNDAGAFVAFARCRVLAWRESPRRFDSKAPQLIPVSAGREQLAVPTHLICSRMSRFGSKLFWKGLRVPGRGREGPESAQLRHPDGSRRRTAVHPTEPFPPRLCNGRFGPNCRRGTPAINWAEIAGIAGVLGKLG